MSAGWIAAGVVSAIAHVGFAAYVETHEHVTKVHAVLEMQIVPPKPKPRLVTLPEPPPPPPPAPPPKLVKKIVKTVAPPPKPETQRVGITEEATTDKGEVAVPTGVTTEGTLGTGTSMEKDLPPPPPEAPAPPPPPVKKPKFFPSYEVTKLPRAKSAVQPEIPQAFRDAQREALVVVEVEIDASGNVVSARVLKHAEYGLDDSALAAAKHTTFEPALMGTQPVPVRFQIPYRFKVRG
jgi:protein TonB